MEQRTFARFGERGIALTEKAKKTKKSRLWDNELISRHRRTPGGRAFVSLRLKFAVVLVISAVTTTLLALLLIPLTLNLIMNHYTSVDQVDGRLDNYIQSFANYVAQDEVRSDDAAAVVKWTKTHRYVHLVVFEGEKAQFGAAGGEMLEGDKPPVIDPIFTENVTENEDSDAAVIGKTYTVLFADRSCSVSVVDYSASMLYDAVLMIGVILALACFFVVMIFFYHRQIKAIAALSAQVERVSGGELTAHIQNERNDEIGSLARDVDAMRATIITKMEEEREAWEVNSRLITSMSHDIRTPLTTLLGYMELLSADTQNLTPEQKAYVEVCASKAEQIKGLSDKLFLYFWAYHRAEEEVPLQAYPATLLLEQMLGEWMLPMESEGMQVELSLEAIPAEAGITVNVDCLRRVMDNLFDNVRKYAHRDHPVRVTAHVEGGSDTSTLLLTVKNHIGTPKEGSSGTHVGHRTCAAMMALMGGGFEVESCDAEFAARLSLPVTFAMTEA